uniref:Uncharacterized protein n=1 Tax=Heterorhabditis bacteriophora TaxID=37862 RepID=A0A1I7W9U4_HETBA
MTKNNNNQSNNQSWCFDWSGWWHYLVGK